MTRVGFALLAYVALLGAIFVLACGVFTHDRSLAYTGVIALGVWIMVHALAQMIGEPDE